MLNIECGQESLDELMSLFKFNDAVIRHLVIGREEAVTEASHMAKAVEEDRRRDSERAERDASRATRTYDRDDEDMTDDSDDADDDESDDEESDDEESVEK
jgi:small subunit ribosomal protein S6